MTSRILMVLSENIVLEFNRLKYKFNYKIDLNNTMLTYTLELYGMYY
jgi:hypothetical protein